MEDKFYNFLGLIKKSGNLLEGYNRCEEAIKYNKIQLILIANDVSDNTRKKFMNYASKGTLRIIEGLDKQKLGSSIGREEIKVLGIMDKNMSEKLLSLYSANGDI